MKNRKWLTYTLGTLLTLIALAVVGMAGFRIGMIQNVAFPRMDRTERAAFNQNADQNVPGDQGDNPADKLPANPNGGGPRGNDFGPHGFDRGHRGMPMAGGFFGLIHLTVLALLLWVGYKLASNSGWRLIRVPNQTPTASKPVITETEEEKDSE